MKLFRVELARILSTKSTLLFAAAALLLSVFLAYIPVTYVHYTYEENGQKITLTGQAALRRLKELREPVAGELTADKLMTGLSVYQNALSRYGAVYGDDCPVNVRAYTLTPYSELMPRLREVTADADTGLSADYAEITAEDAGNFYALCHSHLHDLILLEQKDNPDAVRIADDMYRRVQPPFYYYPGYTADMVEYSNLILFLIMLLCALITAPLFCCEYQTGADDILRSTRYGRRHLAVAKILCALCISLSLFTVCMAVFSVVSNSIFGWECLGTSLQLLFSVTCLLPLTVGQLLLLVTAAGLIAVTSTVCLTLLLSASCKNTTMAVGITVALCLFPSLFYMTAGTDLAAYLRVLLPSGGLGGSNCFLYALTYYFEFLQIGPCTVWTPWLLLAVPLAEIPVFLLLTVRTYCRRSL